jgi:hypothetical protein
MGVRTTICGGSCAGRLAACLAFAVLGSFAIASPPPALAGDYTVDICTRSPNGGDGNGVTLVLDPGSTGFSARAACDRIPAEIELTARGASVTGGSRWELRAPPGTLIRTLTGIREQIATWESTDLVWEIRNGSNLLERIFSAVPGGPLTYTVDSDLVFAHLGCPRGLCVAPDGSFDTSVAFENLVATLEDTVVPDVAIDPPLSSRAVSGTVEIPFVAHDEGSGIVAVLLLVDEDLVGLVSDRNDGKCVLPFRFLAPCKLDIRSAIPLDTTELSDGTHEVEVVTVDASNELGSARPLSIEVRNAPDPPKSPPSTTPPQMLDRTAPALSGAALSRRRFRVGKARTALIARANSPSGTVLRFSSSEVGTLSLAITKAKKGAKPIATLTRSIAAGRGKIPLSGRIGNKPLRPGRYRLALSARDAAGNASAPIALLFTILPAG